MQFKYLIFILFPSCLFAQSNLEVGIQDTIPQSSKHVSLCERKFGKQIAAGSLVSVSIAFAGLSFLCFEQYYNVRNEVNKENERRRSVGQTPDYYRAYGIYALGGDTFKIISAISLSVAIPFQISAFKSRCIYKKCKCESE